MFGFQLEMNVMDETEELYSMLDDMLNQDREGNKVQEGTDFVNEHIKVSGNTREDELMDIVRAYYNVMEHGLAMLGIAVPEAM